METLCVCVCVCVLTSDLPWPPAWPCPSCWLLNVPSELLKLVNQWVEVEEPLQPADVIPSTCVSAFCLRMKNHIQRRRCSRETVSSWNKPLVCLHYCYWVKVEMMALVQIQHVSAHQFVTFQLLSAWRSVEERCLTSVGERGYRGGFIVNIRLSFINISPACRAAANDDSHCRSICELLRILFWSIKCQKIVKTVKNNVLKCLDFIHNPNIFSLLPQRRNESRKYSHLRSTNQRIFTCFA